jgi:hypothetical protein
MSPQALALLGCLLLPVALADLGHCDTATTLSKYPDPSTDLCKCRGNWAGPECDVCTTNSACSLMAVNGSAMVCDRSLAVYNRVDGFCRVSTKDVSNLLNGNGYITADLISDGTVRGEGPSRTGGRRGGAFGPFSRVDH